MRIWNSARVRPRKRKSRGGAPDCKSGVKQFKSAFGLLCVRSSVEEHLASNERVVGSNPTGRTLHKNMIDENKKKYAIIGKARTGTTNLACMMQHHPELKSCEFEPLLFKYRDRLREGKLTIEEVVQEIYSKNDGIKELITDAEYFPSFKKHILGLPVKIIYTTRKNLLKQTISFWIGMKIKVWQRESKFDREEYLKKIRSLEVSFNEIKNFLEETIVLNQEFKNLLKNRDYFELNYEDFYLSDLKNQERVLKEMFDFIGVTPLVNDHMRNVLEHGRLNDNDTYLNIKNFREIERKFAHKYGSLIGLSML